MACNENIIKNMANEITRNCQTHSVQVENEFVIYVIELLLLNPKYGKLFTKTLNRDNLEYFVNDFVSMMTAGDQTTINTLKMQFIIQTNYDKLPNLIDKHLVSIDSTLRPLVTEILEADPEEEPEFHKLFRKISVYIILASGLGSPAHIMTLKEGMAALESVFSIEDLQLFVALPRTEKKEQLTELLAIVSGVRLFNRDCKKGGDQIPDLPFNLVDAGKACLAALSNSLFGVMQRVNTLTAAIEDTAAVESETGNVMIKPPDNTELSIENYQHIFNLLAFSRQYEVIIRRLLSDVELMDSNANLYVERVREALENLHAAVKYKAAVPVAVVFPLFGRLWHTWRGMQNIMYLVSTVNRVMTALANLQGQMQMPTDTLDTMLAGKAITTDQERMSKTISIEERLSMGSLRNYVQDTPLTGEKHTQYLGFCALCLCAGALVPGNPRFGLIKHGGRRYAFCSVKMATQFSKEPQRYVNEVLHYARNNPHVINLLNIWDAVYQVRDVDSLVVKHVKKIKVHEKEIQTEAHPIAEYKEKNYHWDLWEWKRRACQWATIVNCRTKSTQTNYSHLRSEIHCQTVEPRDKCYQTKKDAGMTTNFSNNFIWGLRGKIGYGQHWMDFVQKEQPEKLKAQTFTACMWPCDPDTTPSETDFQEQMANKRGDINMSTATVKSTRFSILDCFDKFTLDTKGPAGRHS
ncbi:cilia- and flagella-associated protein 206-like [Leguminivora glycinivorella]|uniref:cilia- and flagella-associated protein 206-like n=1 Tax=Leguminivora glycinivorella TaxID=1035111 RepID=UPI00200CB82D|nr:cilia- and flagella-associated protein 206-like [Leguminivora glycinivorella]